MTKLHPILWLNNEKFKNNFETDFVIEYHFLNLRLVLEMLNNNTLL